MSLTSILINLMCACLKKNIIDPNILNGSVLYVCMYVFEGLL